MAPSPGVGSMRRPISRVFILLAICLVLQCLLWRGKQRLKHYQPIGSGLTKRLDHSAANESKPADITTATTLEDDSEEWGVLDIDYWGIYEKATPGQKPLVFVTYVIWAAFLFATIGISASDFFCPNLATVADRLGMSESTAGVTFLAFG